ncbi:hypothetical protein U5N59_17835 [Niallia circulans]|nr:hypothetical protein [Niallia circulans]
MGIYHYFGVENPQDKGKDKITSVIGLILLLGAVSGTISESIDVLVSF